MERLLFFIVSIILAAAAFYSCGTAGKTAASGKWGSLFNGKDIADWTVKIHHHDVGINFGNTFRVKNNTIQVRYDEYGNFNEQFGHLYYKTPYSYFHLKLEYRFCGRMV